MTSVEDAGCVFRPYEDRDAEQLCHFRCANVSQHFTRDPEKFIRRAPATLGRAGDEELLVAVAEMPDAGIVGVVVYHALRVNSPFADVRPYIAAIGVRAEYRRRGIATRLKQSAILDMNERGLAGPVVSVVHVQNTAMHQLNASRFNAFTDLYPDDARYELVTVAARPEV